jgi:hypothetical protein
MFHSPQEVMLTVGRYVSGYLLDPLLAPAHAHFNTLVGLIVFVIISAIGIAYTGSL